MEADVVGDHQIYKTIVIVIAEGGTHGVAPVGDTRLTRNIGEGTITVISVEHVPTQTSNVEIGPAVVVVVAHSTAVGKSAGCGDAGLVCNVGESPIVIVVVEGTARPLVLLHHVDGGRVGEVNVGPAIAIVINQQDT